MKSKLSSNQKQGLLLSLTFSLAALLAILYYTTSKETWKSLQQVQPLYLALALAAVILAWFIEGYRLKRIAGMLGEGKNISIFSYVKVFLTTFFFAGITPMAVGEWPALIFYLHKSGISLAESTAAMVIRTILTKLFFLVLAVILLILYEGHISGVETINLFFRMALALLVLSSSFYFIVIIRPKIIWQVLKFLKKVPFLKPLASSRRLQKFFQRLREEAEQFHNSLSRLGKYNKGRLIFPALLTVAYWFTYFLVAPLLLMGLGLDFYFWSILVWHVLVVLIIAYNPVPGGSGFVELSLATFFAAYVPAHTIGIFVIAWRFFTYYLYLFFGGLLAARPFSR